METGTSDHQPTPLGAPSQAPPPPPQEPANWQFNPGDSVDPATQAPAVPHSTASVSWTASEFIAHQKSGGWYMLLALAGVVAAGLIYLLTRDIISVGIILLAAVTLGVFAARKPRTLEYSLDSSGVHIGQKTYPYADFKSFSVDDDGPVSSITLMPLKRFMPPISMYYDRKDEEKVTGTLSSYLPFEEHQRDVVDNLMRRIRF